MAAPKPEHTLAIYWGMSGLLVICATSAPSIEGSLLTPEFFSTHIHPLLTGKPQPPNDATHIPPHALTHLLAAASFRMASRSSWE